MFVLSVFVLGEIPGKGLTKNIFHVDQKITHTYFFKPYERFFFVIYALNSVLKMRFKSETGQVLINMLDYECTKPVRDLCTIKLTTKITC